MGPSPRTPRRAIALLILVVLALSACGTGMTTDIWKTLKHIPKAWASVLYQIHPDGTISLDKVLVETSDVVATPLITLL